MGILDKIREKIRGKEKKRKKPHVFGLVMWKNKDMCLKGHFNKELIKVRGNVLVDHHDLVTNNINEDPTVQAFREQGIPVWDITEGRPTPLSCEEFGRIIKLGRRTFRREKRWR